MQTTRQITNVLRVEKQTTLQKTAVKLIANMKTDGVVIIVIKNLQRNRNVNITRNFAEQADNHTQFIKIIIQTTQVIAAFGVGGKAIMLQIVMLQNTSKVTI
jgi:hypothetical protein